jgi:hypothetical protein
MPVGSLEGVAVGVAYIAGSSGIPRRMSSGSAWTRRTSFYNVLGCAGRAGSACYIFCLYMISLIFCIFGTFYFTLYFCV